VYKKIASIDRPGDLYEKIVDRNSTEFRPLLLPHCGDQHLKWTFNKILFLNLYKNKNNKLFIIKQSGANDHITYVTRQFYWIDLNEKFPFRR